ncbi:hypothetical protein PHISCL_05844 [Aspergillus sclerotialis]|uniref:Uncharacterized protein n=1 Tax=Aspergillus sclerotialis TaxID=2070753 RepID=A0A3A2ZV00_9EURO|nr:hypothetical protein PHISCL_05844 [Aspergillus sclerotialis]
MKAKQLLTTFFLPTLGTTLTTPVQTGLDVLIANNYTQLSGRKVLILTNPTGITPNLELGVDVMHRSGQVDLAGVLGPEHGFRGTAQAGGSEGTFTDELTGLTVYDAYNVNTSTLISYIRDSKADTVVYDIQDVGVRFYTYTWAMYDTMLAAALTNTKFVVLDRPNPITGLNAFGPVLKERYSSYVGRKPIAQAHGMTSGELARMFVGQGWIKQDANGSDLTLEVVKMDGWERKMSWAETGLHWVLPSPNMPTPDTALIYPGAGMFEGTNMSEGRGTTRPFELLGAPFGNTTWVVKMRELDIPNTNYRFACFTPTTSKFKSRISCGVQSYITLTDQGDYERFDPVYLGTSLLWTAKHLYTSGTKDGFEWLKTEDTGEYNVDLLVGSPLIREGIDAGLSPEDIQKQWMKGLEEFKGDRGKYLLY